MANEYTLHFSDPTKQETITVPAMPPGLNTVDTSLNLVGRGYPNYGLKFAENFLHLLENFSSPLPPENPIEGQLWFDTSNSGRKVLRIMDGTATAVRWPSATGIYQQSTDPNDQFTAKNGDIWVDTGENSLKLWDGLNWQLVGPSSSTLGTGSVVENIKATDNKTYPVIKNFVSGNVISIISGLDTAAFTPLSVIDGFQQIKPGITLSSKIQNNISSQVYGTASNAYNLRIENANYPSTEFLRKSDTSQVGQEITGKIVFRTASAAGSLGRDGIVILPTGKTTEYAQLYKDSNDAVLLNNTIGGKLKLQTNPTGLSNDLITGLEIDPVNGITAFVPATLANLRSAITTSSELTVTTNAVVGGNLTVSGSTVLGNARSAITTATQLTVSNNLTVSGVIYAAEIRSATSTTSTFYGNVVGSASKLSVATQMAVQGQVTATQQSFVGDGSSISFNTRLTPAAISGQTTATTVTTTATMLVLENDTLLKITKKNFLQDVASPGMISLWASATGEPPSGWLSCDGSSKSILEYPDLFAAISYAYGNSGPVFDLPLLAQVPDNRATPLFYIIKY